MKKEARGMPLLDETFVFVYNSNGRGILVNLCKIDINDDRNIAVMKKDDHRVIHTNLYDSLLTASMLLGYMMDETEGVLLVLKFYKDTLEALK